MRRFLPAVLAFTLAACGGGKGSGTPLEVPPPPPPPAQVPTTLIIQAGNNQEAAPGEEVATVPSVQVVDRNGQPMAGIAVQFAVDAGGGKVVGQAATTGSDGKASPISWTLGALPGENRLKATSGILTPAQFSATGRYLVGTTQLTGSVTLPAGAQVGKSTLRIQTGISDVPVGADGSFTDAVETGVITLAGAVAPNGNAILFGWIDGQKKTLSVRTTAEVLTYFDVLAYLQPVAQAQKIIRDYLAAGADLHELEAAISSALTASAATVTLETVAVVTARKAVVQRLQTAAGHTSSGSSSHLVVEPGATPKSGAIVDQQGFNSVLVTNNWRRRVAWFVDRLSYVPKGGHESISSINRGAKQKLAAVSAATSVIGTGIDIMFGNLAYTPVVSSPFTLTRFPADARSTRYRVTVVGPGHINSSTPLTTEQSDAMLEAGLETLVMEFVIPMLDQVLSADNLARDLGRAPELETIVHTLLDVNPQAVTQAINEGDLKTAFVETMKLLFDSGKGQGVLTPILVFAGKRYGLASEEAVLGRVKKFQRVLALVEIIATSVASAQVAADVWNASEGESWDVTVAAADLAIDPATATTSQLDIQLLRAKVLDASDGELPTFGYRWSTTGTVGQLCGAFHACGTSFESSQDVVTYTPDPNKEGSDDVKVEVYVTEGTRKTVIGEATAKMTTFAIKVDISPTSKTLKSGEFVTFNATLDPRFKQEGLITYRFSTPGALGQIGLNLTSIESGTPSATYSAKMEVAGTEPLTVEVFQTKDNVRRRLGSATAMITVEKVKPTVVQGRYFTEVHTLPNNRICVGAYIAFPLVQGAAYYDMHAYNFNDPLFWHTDISLAIFLVSYGTWGTCDVKGLISGSTGSEFIFMLSGGSGPASGGTGVDALDARFAGMKIDVTVKYTP